MEMKKFSDEELTRLLNEIESDKVERKRSFGSETKVRVREAVCAFANDLPDYKMPGIIIIGAEDDGTPSNLPITDELLRALADIKTDGRILPLPTMFVEKRHLKGADMAVIFVIPSDMPPVKFDGRICIRVGSRRAYASAQDERILIEKRRYNNLPFDISPIPPARLSDLSKSIFDNEYLPSAFAADILAANERTYEERLASCKMIVSPNDTTPTILGLLSIGKSPQDYLPGAYVQFLRINGVELADPVTDAESIGGAFIDLLRRAEEKLKAHNTTSVDISSKPTHDISPAYPMPAIQQILYNAVLHRTYERTNAPCRIYWFNDRIEFHSPGGPYGNVTAENFGQPGITDYRNPNIGDVLKTFGYIQAFGRGIATARRELEKNGNPNLEISVNQNNVVCTLRRKP